MQQLEGRVAVVTGAASGMGRAMAERFAQEGMRVVLADVDRERLDATEAAIRDAGGTALAVVTDVTSAVQVQALARRTLDEWGGVHVLCNNAGGGATRGAIWEIPLERWRWVMELNFWGVLHGVHAFVPAMLERGDEGHIVNTASGVVLGTKPWQSPYNASKHAVVGLTETLHHELLKAGAPIRVSLLCPGFVQTRTPGSEEEAEQLRGAMQPERVAAQVVAAIRGEQFYVLTHPEALRERARTRAEDIVRGRDPTRAPGVLS
jgi:NAD(P)-dependent dehydrogenase (short-subunit alcohol dehydrogenase family)